MVWFVLYLLGCALIWFGILVYCKVADKDLEDLCGGNTDALTLLLFVWPASAVFYFIVFVFYLTHMKMQHLASKVAAKIVARRKNL